MDHPVLLQLKDLFPLIEIEAVHPRFVDECRQLSWRQASDLTFGMNTDPEQYFVLGMRMPERVGGYSRPNFRTLFLRT